VVLLFVPIYLETDAHYDMNRRKFAFSVYGFKWIKLFGGYVATYPGGLAVHLSEKKAVVIPYSQLKEEQKRFSYMRTLRLRSLRITTETGAEYLLPIAISHVVLRIFFFVIGGKKERIRNNLWLTDGDVLRVSVNIVAWFTLFDVLCGVFKVLKEKLKIVWMKKIKKSAI